LRIRSFIQRLGIVDQRLRQPDAARHAFRVFLKLPSFVAIKADFVDQLLRATLPHFGRHGK
jgi:hypothetical protein